jgi:hypothetical protein
MTCIDIKGKERIATLCQNCRGWVYWSVALPGAHYVHDKPGAWLFCPKASPRTEAFA